MAILSFTVILLLCSIYEIRANPLSTSPLYSDEKNSTTNNGEAIVNGIVEPSSTLSSREGKNIENNESGGSKTNAMEEMFLKKLSNKCNNKKDTSSCVMLKLMNYMNRLLKKTNFEISDSVEITQTSPLNAEPSSEPIKFETDESSRAYTEESVFTELIADKLWNFLKSRSLKWKLLPEAAVVLSTSSDEEGNLNLGVALRSSGGVEEGRGKMKNLGPIIAAGIMKMGMLKVLAFKALALLVGKALLVSKLAFLLAAAIGLKKLFSQQRHVTYEVVAHPHHTHSSVESHGHGDSYSSGWGRSGGDAQTLAYRGHLQK